MLCCVIVLVSSSTLHRPLPNGDPSTITLPSLDVSNATLKDNDLDDADDDLDPDDSVLLKGIQDFLEEIDPEDTNDDDCNEQDSNDNTALANEIDESPIEDDDDVDENEDDEDEQEQEVDITLFVVGGTGHNNPKKGDKAHVRQKRSPKPRKRNFSLFV